MKREGQTENGRKETTLKNQKKIKNKNKEKSLLAPVTFLSCFSFHYLLFDARNLNLPAEFFIKFQAQLFDYYYFLCLRFLFSVCSVIPCTRILFNCTRFFQNSFIIHLLKIMEKIFERNLKSLRERSRNIVINNKCPEYQQLDRREILHPENFIAIFIFIRNYPKI